MQPNSEYATFRAGLLLSGWIAASVTLEHQGEKLDLRAYVKEIDDGFGIGQQSAAEKGVRNIGVDGRAQISEQFFFDGEASWQQNLETDAIRNTARAQIRYENNGLTAATGLVHASDEFSDAETLESNLVEVSIAKKLGKITLRAGGSFELSDAARRGLSNYQWCGIVYGV